MITYTSEKKFSQSDVESLFLSVGWHSGHFPLRLHRALLASSFVATAWEDGRLVGLVRTFDDGCMTAFVHYLLVAPDCQGKGVASSLMSMVRERYADYLYVNVMPEDSANEAFYVKQGFVRLPGAVSMQIKRDIVDC